MSQRSVRVAVCAGLGVVLALTGCSTIKVKLGLRLSLAKTPVTAMELSQYRYPGIGPGERSSLIATFQAADGKTLVSEGKGKGKVLWSDLTVVPTVVLVNKKGVLTLPRDPRVSDGKTGYVVVTVKSQPAITAALDVPLRYNYAFTSSYAGVNGSNGSDGTNGVDGASGSPGSTDLDKPSPGGAGGDGTSGGNGTNGGDGGNGPAVQVMMTLRPGDYPLLQFGVVVSGHRERYYLVDPQGGSLTVSSQGGSGGFGGKGGRGGAGGSGGSGIPPGSNGSSGNDGSDGQSGSDGSGGSIAVTYDPSAQPYLALLKLSNPGGPKPVWTQASVAPLW